MPARSAFESASGSKRNSFSYYPRSPFGIQSRSHQALRVGNQTRLCSVRVRVSLREMRLRRPGRGAWTVLFLAVILGGSTAAQERPIESLPGESPAGNVDLLGDLKAFRAGSFERDRSYSLEARALASSRLESRRSIRTSRPRGRSRPTARAATPRWRRWQWPSRPFHDSRRTRGPAAPRDARGWRSRAPTADRSYAMYRPRLETGPGGLGESEGRERVPTRGGWAWRP